MRLYKRLRIAVLYHLVLRIHQLHIAADQREIRFAVQAQAHNGVGARHDRFFARFHILVPRKLLHRDVGIFRQLREESRITERVGKKLVQFGLRQLFQRQEMLLAAFQLQLIAFGKSLTQ
ncbi:hypothetical protein D1872_277300 [compost metagenome]